MVVDFSLLETILYDPNEGFYLLDGHLARLLQSAINFHERDPSLFAILPTSDLVLDALRIHVPQTPTYKRVRLLVSKDTSITVEFTELDRPPVQAQDSGLLDPTEFIPNTNSDHDGTESTLPTVVLSKTPLPCAADDPFLQNKTTYRAIYNAVRDSAGVGQEDGPFDVVLWNDQRQVTETSIANIAIQTMKDGDGNSVWITPKKECGLLPGVFREMLLATGKIIEGIITVDDLIRAQKDGRPIVCFNSVRKAYRVRLIY